MPGISLRSFDLKLLAVLFMLIDHIGIYFEGTPLLLRYIGRLAYPLFLFCLVWSYHHTRSRVRFCLRLYLMGLFMAFLGWWIDSRWPTDMGYGNHNIFVTMLLTCLIISVIELAGKDWRRCAGLLGLILAVQLAYYIVPQFAAPLRHISGDTLSGIFPNLALVEFGSEFIALGVCMYFLREKPAQLVAAYLAFCLYQFSAEILFYGLPVQFWMIFALPFMLAYNGQRGPGLKWFFYIFYPAHTVLLFWLANFIFK